MTLAALIGSSDLKISEVMRWRMFHQPTGHTWEFFIVCRPSTPDWDSGDQMIDSPMWELDQFYLVFNEQVLGKAPSLDSCRALARELVKSVSLRKT